MGLNTTTKDTYNYVDDFNMVLQQNLQNPADTYNNGWNDSIGRTFEMFWLYGWMPFYDAIRSCFTWDTKRKCWFSIRHPNYVTNDMSRDHVAYAIMATIVRYGKDKEKIKEFVDGFNWRISDKACFTIDMWLWSRAAAGYWWAKPLFYLVEIPVFIVILLCNKLMFKIGGFTPEPSQQEYINREPYTITPWDKKIYNLIVPTYACYNESFRLHLMKDSIWKKICQKLLCWRSPEHNLGIKLLCNGKVSKEEVDGYLPMSGDRWTSNLVKQICGRYHIILTGKLAEFNCIDVDQIHKLYYGHID
jgi:hypothetical protein